VFEILGLAGSGKSSTIKYIKQKNNNVKDTIKYKKIDYFILSKIIKLIHIFLLTKNIRHIKEYITFLMMFKSIKKDNSQNIICFDQGPLFILTKLIIEIPQQENFFLQEMRKIIPYYSEIIYLNTPIDILANRIDNRKQNHRIKGKKKDEKEKFLKNYIKLYNKVIIICSEYKVNVIEINTNINSIAEVGELVIERFKK